MRSSKPIAILLTFLLVVRADTASLPNPALACDTGALTNTTCDRTTDASTTINKPTHVVAGDLLVAQCYSNGSSINSLTGFTEIAADSIYSTFRETAFWKMANDTPEAATYTLGVTGGATHGCYMAAYRNVAQSSAYESNAAHTTGNDTSGELSNITTTADNALVWYACQINASTTCSTPSGFTEEQDAGVGFCSGFKIQASAGSIGSVSVTWGAAADWSCVTASFAPNTTGTRIYLPSTGAPAVSPTFDSAWEDTDQATRLAAVFTKGSTAMTTLTVNEETADVTVIDYLGPQYSIQIGAQTISGLVQCNMRVAESATGNNQRSQSKMWLADSSGASTAEVLLDHLGNSTSGNPTDEWGTALAARNINRKSTDANAHTLTSQTSANNDYLVMELGWRAHNVTTTAASGTMRVGDTAATALDRDDTETTDNHPYCDFLSGLAAPSGGAPPCVNTMALMGVGCK